MEKLISIVMGVHNGERYLRAQIESILSQTHRNLELLLYDDLSTDGSLSIAREYALKDARIRVFQNQANLGVAKNFLKGLLSAKGEYVCFSDQDDYWESDKLAVLSRLLDKDKENMLAYSDLEVCDQDLNIINKSFWKIAGVRPRKGHLGDKAVLRNIIPGCSMMFRGEVLDLLIRGKDKFSFLHDHLAFIFASHLGKIAYHRRPLIKYRQHDANQIGISHKLIYDKTAFRRRLKEDIAALKAFLNTELPGLEAFSNDLLQKGIMQRLRCIQYYLFVRNDRTLDKILGFLECLSPSFYDFLRYYKNHH